MLAHSHYYGLCVVPKQENRNGGLSCDKNKWDIAFCMAQDVTSPGATREETESAGRAGQGKAKGKWKVRAKEEEG